MGIQGLLQFIKDASEPVNVKKYKGQTVAVDTYCWLHKGAFSCAEKLARGEPTDQYVTFCMKFVDMLLSSGVKPILVFDGRNLPSKNEVEKARRERRQANLQKGKQLLREGKISEARDCFARSVNVTPAMAHDVIKAARTRGVDCVVAPYEADAQLAFLNKTGIAQAVITEDSDLLAFGCKKVVLKMDKMGNGLEIDQSNLGRCRSLGDVFTEEKFRYMCILSGCDYLASLYGIGLGKACRLLRLASNPDILKVIKKMGQYLKMNVTVPDEYIEGFVKANNTFLYQLVFDPINRKVVPLNPYPDNIDPASLSYAGHNIGDEKGLQMALGNLDINTMTKIDDYNPDTAQPTKPRSRGWNDRPERRFPLETSIWSKAYTPNGVTPSLPPVPASPEKPSPRGRDRVVTVKGPCLPLKEAQVKRPREESSISEEDMLLQYSSSDLKKQRREETRPPADDGDSLGARRGVPPAGQPRPRNRFATLLQRRNQDDESGDEQCTRSRFFCSVSSQETESPQQEASESKGPEAKVPDSPIQPNGSPPVGCDAEAGMEDEEARTPGPLSSRSQLASGRGRGAFDWPSSQPERPQTPSRMSGLSVLQRFQRKKDSFSWSGPSRTSPSRNTTPPPEDRESPPDSPPSQDSAYFSQPGHTEDPLHNSSSPVELSTSLESDSSESSPVLEKKPTAIKAKVSGLPRVSSGDLAKGAKIRPSAPAKASGLRRKPAGPGKKSPTNNENAPGLQATISSLWKNYSFKKERPRINPGTKGDPMSPVKDNVPALTPETEKDIYFISESTSLKKTICL